MRRFKKRRLERKRAKLAIRYLVNDDQSRTRGSILLYRYLAIYTSRYSGEISASEVDSSQSIEDRDSKNSSISRQSDLDNLARRNNRSEARNSIKTRERDNSKSRLRSSIARREIYLDKCSLDNIEEEQSKQRHYKRDRLKYIPRRYRESCSRTRRWQIELEERQSSSRRATQKSIQIQRLVRKIYRLQIGVASDDQLEKFVNYRSASRAAISQKNLRAIDLSRRRQRLVRKAIDYKSASQSDYQIQRSNEGLLSELVVVIREKLSILYSIERLRDEDYRRDELLKSLSLTRSQWVSQSCRRMTIFFDALNHDILQTSQNEMNNSVLFYSVVNLQREEQCLSHNYGQSKGVTRSNQRNSLAAPDIFRGAVTKNSLGECQ